MTKTEQLEDSINKIITANLQPFGTRMGSPSYVYTGKGDEATQIIKACEKAGLAFVVKGAELPEVEGRYGSMTSTNCRNTQADMLKAGWEKTEEIECPG